MTKVQTKVQQEVTQIIAGQMTIPSKIKALNELKYEGRPGAQEARDERDAFIGRIKSKTKKIRMNLADKRSGFWRENGGGICYGKKAIDCFYSVKRGSYNSIKKQLAEEKFNKHLESIGKEITGDVKREIGYLYETKVEQYQEYRLNFVNELAKQKAFKEQTGLNYSFKNGKTDVLTAQTKGSVDAYQAKKLFFQAGGYTFVVRHDETVVWEDKNDHWPKKTIDSRYVTAYKDGKQVSITVERFAGNYLINAIAEFLGLKEIKFPRALKPIQGNSFFDLEIVRKIGKIKIYRRTFGGETVDYCATAGTENYHANTEAAALAGLRKKIEAAKRAYEAKQRADSKAWTAQELNKEFEFCWTEMRNFCNVNGLDIDGCYTVQEIRNAALRNKAESCQRWAGDLRKIGINLNCK